MLDATDQNTITTSDGLPDQAQCSAQDQAPSLATVENTSITMRVDDLIALVRGRVIATIRHLQVSAKIRKEIKIYVQDAITELIGEKDSYQLFSDHNDLDTFVATATAIVAKNVRDRGVDKLNSGLKRLEVAIALGGNVPDMPIKSLSASELTTLSIKAFRTGQFKLEAQCREELLWDHPLPVDDIIWNLTHLISAYERIPDIERAIALSEIFLEYLKTQVTDEQVTLKTSRNIFILRTKARIERLKMALAANQT